MKIYRVVIYDNAHAYYHYGTRKEATAAAKEFRAELADSEWPNATIEIEALDVAATRAGIASALQALVDETCMNEH